MKFTNAGEVVFAIKLLREDANQVTLQFAVRDTGIGMTPHRCRACLPPSRRPMHPRPAGIGGTGLGLAISKHLVELMGVRLG